MLLLAARSGTVKKTPEQYADGVKGLIAVKLKEGDELVGQSLRNRVTNQLATASGMAIRSLNQTHDPWVDTSGVRGIKLGKGDSCWSGCWDPLRPSLP